MARWLVELDGERYDLEEFPYWFPNGDVYAIEEYSKVYLVGAAFEKFGQADQVHQSALHAFDEFSGIITLLCPNFHRPAVGKVILEDDTGKRQGFVFASGTLNARFKLRASATVGSGEQAKASPTQAQSLLSGSRVDPHLQMAVSLWSDPLKTGPRLYLVLEEVERYLGQKVHQAKFCSKNERIRFRRSVNSEEVFGKDARHASGKYEPPCNPMNLVEAIAFVARVLGAALARASTPAVRP